MKTLRIMTGIILALHKAEDLWNLLNYRLLQFVIHALYFSIEK